MVDATCAMPSCEALPSRRGPADGNWKGIGRELQHLNRDLTGVDFVGADLVEVSPPFDTGGITSITAALTGSEFGSPQGLDRSPPFPPSQPPRKRPEDEAPLPPPDRPSTPHFSIGNKVTRVSPLLPPDAGHTLAGSSGVQPIGRRHHLRTTHARNR